MTKQIKESPALWTFFLLVIGIISTSFILLSSSFSDGIIRHDVDIKKYRELGRQPQFNCVARYSASASSGDFAAGVLISPNWVITAAHFVEDSSLWFIGDAHYKTRRIIKHPKLSQLPEGRKAQWDGWDLALIELNNPVLNVKPAFRYSGSSELDMIISKIGYGYVGNGIAGMQSPMVQERLGGHNTIDLIGGEVNGINLGSDVLLCDFDSPGTDEFNKLGSPVPLELEIGGSKGDSGAGVFAKTDGQWQLVGIVSGAMNREIKYGAIMAFARVSSANIWIDSVISESFDK